MNTIAKRKSRVDVRKICVTGMMGALASILMFIEFPIPALIPSFIKFDLSELPALLTSFALGPVYGVVVCLIKNLVNLMNSSSGGVGELSNFILGCAFVFPAGLVYKIKQTRISAFIASICGALFMAVLSIFSNYFFIYPIYEKLMPMEAILDAYRAINSNVDTLWDALIWFNAPFTFVKGLFCVAITFLVYKKLSPILKGKERQ